MSRGIGLTEWLRAIISESATPLFQLLSLPGDLLVVVPLLGLLYLSDVIRSIHEASTEATAEEMRPLCSDRTAFIIGTVFGGLALVVVLESLFAMPRPPTEWHAVDASPHGFPSGHTMAAVVLWGALAQWSTVGRRSTRYIVAGVLISFVGFSRLGLGVHYAVDIIAAIGFGGLYLWAVAVVTNQVPQRMFAVAVGIAVLAVVVSGANSRALLALAGTVGAAVGWWVVEQPVVKRQLLRLNRL